MNYTSEDGLIFYIGFFITVAGIIVYASSFIYYNSTYFLKNKFRSLGLTFVARPQANVNEINPFTGLRNNDIRKIHFDDGPKKTKRAIYYYDKVKYLDKSGTKKESWIKVSFGGFTFNKIMFQKDV